MQLGGLAGVTSMAMEQGKKRPDRAATNASGSIDPEKVYGRTAMRCQASRPGRQQCRFSAGSLAEPTPERCSSAYRQCRSIGPLFTHSRDPPVRRNARVVNVLQPREVTSHEADSDIKRDVEAELKWAPDVCETDIAGKVTSGSSRSQATR